MKKLLLLLPVACCIFSCEKDDNQKPQDTTSPRIEKVLINGQSSEVALEQGDTLNIELLLTDNEALNSAKLEIHHAGDGHAHRKAVTEFSYSEIISLQGTSEDREIKVKIAEDAEIGEYHFTVLVLDNAGNESAQYVTEFEVLEDTGL